MWVGLGRSLVAIKQQSKCCELWFNKDWDEINDCPRDFGGGRRTRKGLAELLKWLGIGFRSGGQVHSYSNHICGVALWHRYCIRTGCRSRRRTDGRERIQREGEIIRSLGGLGDTFGIQGRFFSLLSSRAFFLSFPGSGLLWFVSSLGGYILDKLWVSIHRLLWGSVPYSGHTKHLFVRAIEWVV